LKIWDLQQQKTLYQENLKSAITSLTFHPSERIMACATDKKSVRFYDLNGFELMTRTPVNPTRIDKIAFHQDGKALLSASASGLKVWGWNERGARLLDHVETGWSGLADMATTDSGLLYGLSTTKGIVRTTAVKLYKVCPFKTSAKSPVSPPGGLAVDPSLAVQGTQKPIQDRGGSHPSTDKGDTGGGGVTDRTLSRQEGSEIVKQDRENKEPIGLSMSAFLPVRDKLNADKVLSELRKDHMQFSAILTQRRHRLKVVRTFWNKGDAQGAIEALIKIEDRSKLPVASDFLKHSMPKMKMILTLDLCRDLLPIFVKLVKSRFESYITTGLEYLKFVLKSFSRVISSTLSVKPDKGIVNVQFEDRRQRCRDCYRDLMSSKPALVSLARKKKGGSIQTSAQEVLKMVESIEI